jgi:uncharacterized membrane protein
MVRDETVVEQPQNRAVATPAAAARVGLLLLILTALALVSVKTIVPAALSRTGDWPEVGLVMTLAAGTLLFQTRQVPFQNVLLAACILGGIGGLANLVGAATGLPFGPIQYTHAAGPRLAGTVPWWMPLVWIIALLNSRGAARFILRTVRHQPNYGLGLIALTTALSLLLDLGLELFATRLKGYWLWQAAGPALSWQGIPLTQFAGWMVTALIALALATPVLINKKPVDSPPDCRPLILWTVLSLFLAVMALCR